MQSQDRHVISNLRWDVGGCGRDEEGSSAGDAHFVAPMSDFMKAEGASWRRRVVLLELVAVSVGALAPAVCVRMYTYISLSLSLSLYIYIYPLSHALPKLPPCQMALVSYFSDICMTLGTILVSFWDHWAPFWEHGA